MPTRNAKDRQPRTSEDWVVSKHKRFRANIIVWGMPKDLTTFEIRAKLADLGLASFVRGNVLWEGDQVRLVLTPKDSKGLSKELVSQVSSSLRNIGCRCVLDDDIRGSKPVHVDCVNRFEPLTSQKASSSSSSEPSGRVCSGENIDNMHIDVNLVGNKVKTLGGRERERRLRVATWNFSGLGSERKQKEIGELLTKNSIDVVAGQESWEREDTRIEVEGYKWFGKPRSNQNSRRGEGGVGFLVRGLFSLMIRTLLSPVILPLQEGKLNLATKIPRQGPCLWHTCTTKETHEPMQQVNKKHRRSSDVSVYCHTLSLYCISGELKSNNDAAAFQNLEQLLGLWRPKQKFMLGWTINPISILLSAACKKRRGIGFI